MTFLQLCQRLRKEAGVSGTGPSAVTGQTGEYLRLVDWITAAYEDIQNAHKTWRFLRAEFSFSTIASTQEYTPAAVSITDLAVWRRQDMRVYDSESDEQFLHYLPWSDFRVNYKFGNNRSSEGRPSVVTVKPDNSLALWQIPDDVYTIDGEYYKSADVMEANSDVPIFHERFHLAIVWRALMYYGGYEAADERYSHGQNEFRRLKRQMDASELDDLGYGDPLA